MYDSNPALASLPSRGPTVLLHASSESEDDACSLNVLIGVMEARPLWARFVVRCDALECRWSAAKQRRSSRVCASRCAVLLTAP